MHYVAPMVQQAFERLGYPVVHRGRKLTGEGTLIGIIDSGIDAAHPFLRDRVIVEGAGRWVAANPTYEVRSDSHGTRVSLIAAHAAPAARLAVYNFEPTRAGLIEGVHWLMEQAERLDLPLVVNISQGGTHNDAHDGSDPVSREIEDVLDAYGTSGRIFCVAAGNEGPPLALHVSGNATSGTPLRAHVEVRPAESEPWGKPLLSLPTKGELFACGSAEGLALALTIGEETLLCNPNDEESFDFGDFRIDITSSWDRARNRDTLTVKFSAPRGTQMPQIFCGITLRPTTSRTTRVDMWSRDARAVFRQRVNRNGRWTVEDCEAVDATTMVAGVASSPSVITVGGVCDRDGEQGPMLGRGKAFHVPFSNAGPTLDGRRKPDIVSAARWLRVANGTAVLAGEQGPLNGTSYATPMVTGLVAQLLEWDRNLTGEEVRSLLTSTSRLPDDVTGPYTPQLGFGEVQVSLMSNSISG